jgi:hypothetical protein
MELRSIALATTALVAIATFVQPASAGGSSYMGKMNLGFGNAWEDWQCDGGECSTDLDYTTLHGSASVNVPYNDRVNLQFDIFGNESLDEGNDCGSTCGSYYGGFGAGAHLNYRDPLEGALGVFGTVGRAAVASTSSSDYVVFAAGLEGEYYCNAWTFSAQAGYLDTDESGYGLMKEAGFIRAGAAFYPSKRMKLSGNVGYIDGNTTGSDSASDVTEWNWGFTVEYLFGQTVPVSTYLEYKGQSSDAYSPNSFTGDRHEVRAGVRFLFGVSDDLQKADREGAGMESPDILTWPRFDVFKSK